MAAQTADLAPAGNRFVALAPRHRFRGPPEALGSRCRNGLRAREWRVGIAVPAAWQQF